MAERRNSHLVDIDCTPAHHKLQPGDWWQFIVDGALVYADATVKQPSIYPEGMIAARPYEVDDVLIWQFADEPFRRQFRVTAIPLEGVYECAYISQC